MSSIEKFLIPLIDQSDFKILPLAGDASTRKYSRVVSSEEESWVLMEWDAFDGSEDFPFLSVLNYFNSKGITVPKLLGFDPKNGYFLLEDLGDLTLERKFWEFQNQENIVPYYQNTLDELITIHSLNFDSENPKKCTAYHQEFSTEKLLWEFNYTHKHLFRELWKIEFTDREEKDLQTIYQEISLRLAKQPQVVCHRDFHSRNVMLKKGKVVLIDFQDARLGPAAYDLVSLLWDSYVDLNPEVQQDLLLYYCNNFPHFDKVAGSRGEFMDTLNLQIIQRCFKACGSFASFKNTRDDDRYLKYISGTMGRVVSSLKEYPEFSKFLDIIQSNGDRWS